MKQRVGDEITVLVEGASDESELLLQGRHRGQAPEVDGVVILTQTSDEVVQPGELRRAKVTQAAEYDLVAKLLPGKKKSAAKKAPVRSTRLPIVR